MRRDGIGQSVPTAQPYIRILVGADANKDEYRCQGAGGDERIVSVHADEQVWGGSYEVILDNSDGNLTNKDYRGACLEIGWGFSNTAVSWMPHLYVHRQIAFSEEGKLLCKLICMDGWGLLSLARTNISQNYYNQEWQKDGNIDNYRLPSGDPIPAALRAEFVERADMTILEILRDLADLIKVHVTTAEIDDGWPDFADEVLYFEKPPISFDNVISGLRQALEMTSSYMIWWRSIWPAFSVSCFKIVVPTFQTEVRHYYNQANTFFINVQDSGLVVPNRVVYWAYNEAGTDWAEGQANDLTSQAALKNATPPYPVPGYDIPFDGIITRHYYLTTDLHVDARATVDELNQLAEGTLSKIREERGQGYLVAPMHCSQELFDWVEITDPRYSPAKTVKAIVHRIIREYDRGKYQITLYLGGLTTGVTQSLGGNAAVPLHEAIPPRAPIQPGGGLGGGIVLNVYDPLPMPVLAVSTPVSDPGDAIVKTPSMAVPMPSLSLTQAQTTMSLPDDVYIHDGVNLIDTDVTAYNDGGIPYYANPESPSLGDGLYVCDAAKFDCVRYNIDTSGAGTYTMRPAYYNGSEWVAIPSFYASGDETNSFKVTGIRWISFNRPVDWTAFEVDGKMRYILKNEIDYEGSQTNRPMIKQAYIGVWP